MLTYFRWPNDLDGDGISGVPNWNILPSYIIIPDNAISRNGKYICRFGKKAAVFNLLHQTVSAYNQDIGITSSFEPGDVFSGNSISHEVSENTIRNVVAYLQMLKAPIQRCNVRHMEVNLITGEVFKTAPLKKF